MLQCYAQHWCCGGLLALSGLAHSAATLLRSSLVLWWCSRPLRAHSSAAAVLRSTVVLWWYSRPLRACSSAAAVLRSTLVLWWCSRPLRARSPARPPWACRLLRRLTELQWWHPVSVEYVLEPRYAFVKIRILCCNNDEGGHPRQGVVKLQLRYKLRSLAGTTLHDDNTALAGSLLFTVLSIGAPPSIPKCCHVGPSPLP